MSLTFFFEIVQAYWYGIDNRIWIMGFILSLTIPISIVLSRGKYKRLKESKKLSKKKKRELEEKKRK